MKIFRHEFTFDDNCVVLYIVMDDDCRFWMSINELTLVLDQIALDKVFEENDTDNVIVHCDALFAQTQNLSLPSSFCQRSRFVALQYFFRRCQEALPDTKVKHFLLQLWKTEFKPLMERSIQEENKRAEKIVARNYNRDPNAYGYLYLATTASYERDGFYRYGCTTQLNNELKKLNKVRINDHFSMVWMKCCDSMHENMDLLVCAMNKYHVNEEKQFFKFNFGRDELIKLVDTFVS